MIDRRSMGIQRSTEDVWEGKDVVNLIGIVCSPRAHQDFGTSSLSLFIGDLRHGIGQSKEDGITRHRLNHITSHHPALGEAYEDIRPDKGFCQRSQLFTLGSELPLHRIEVGTGGTDHPLGVGHHDVPVICP